MRRRAFQGLRSLFSREARKEKVKARFDSIKEKHAERKETLDEAKDIANAQYVSSTKEIMDEK